MAEEYEMEELADMAIAELSSFISTESQFVEEEHELSSKLMSWDYVIGHLDERIPSEMDTLHEFNRKIAEKLLEIRELSESGRFRDLRILEEDREILQKLAVDVRHRNWKAVTADVASERQEEVKSLRLKKRELKELHSKFLELMKLMKTSRLIEAIEESLATAKEKEEFEKLEEYYFLQIYKFARAYERIFRDLWRKEKMLAGR